MPIYEFRCDECGAEFERLVFASEEPDIKCPKCHSSNARKVMSLFSCTTGVGDSSAASCGPSSGGFS